MERVLEYLEKVVNAFVREEGSSCKSICQKESFMHNEARKSCGVLD